MKRSQDGYILITGLIFVLIISLITVSTLEGTNLDYKISSNESFKNISFQSSESGRVLSGDAVSFFIYHRQWDNYDPAGLSFNSSYDPSTDNAQTGEDLYDTQSLGVDIEYNLSSSSFDPIEADINVIKSPGVKSGGSGLQQLSGYEGLGKGAGAGGVHLIYELRSTGTSAAQAVTVTASEFRVVP